MTDDFFNNTGGEGSARRRVDSLLQRLRENPALAADPQFQAQLNEALAAERSNQARDVSREQTQRVSPANPLGTTTARNFPSRTNAPAGLPSARTAPLPSGLPSAARTRASAPSLPDPNRRIELNATPLPSPNKTTFDPPAPASGPSATLPQVEESPIRVPVPPTLENKPTAIKESSVSPRKSWKSNKPSPTKQAPDEAAPDFSSMPTSSSERSETDFAAFGAMVAGARPTTFNASPSSLSTAEALDAFTTEKSWEKSTPDAFLELLEKRNPRAADASDSARQVALLHDQSALERAANDAPMWLLSLALHLILIVILAFLVVNVELKDFFQVVSEPGFSDEVVLDEVFDPDAAFETLEDANLDVTDMPEVEAETVADVPDVSSFTEETAASLTMTETALALDSAPVGDVENLLGSLNGDDLSGRGKNKAAALAQGGGTEGSEKSVALALAWLAEHQLPDGSWSYDLRQCPSCGGKCRNRGTNNSTIAATAMGVLPFLAAGNTPTTGKYKRVVAQGINYLLDQGMETENGTSFHDGPGNMYAHGLATIAICETYAMLAPRERARYRQLEYAAQEATRFIEYAQASDGGWRYTPKMPGDTSVAGWQMMALKSAELASLEVSKTTLFGMRSFLRDVVALEDGARYAYMRDSSESLATDAIGLLCRLYLDWDVRNETLLKGAKRLADADRSLGNPYYTYYASQLLHNVGGSVWNNWNREMREKLIKAQQMDGHERGSWFPNDADGHCQQGGRLYATSLNCMVLEVYYRHMPLYQKMEASEAFPLEGPGVVGDDAKNADGEADEDFPIEDFSDEE